MSNNKPIEHAGLSLTLTEWARRSGVPASTIAARVEKFGWSFADAIATPPDPRFRRGGRKKKGVPRPCQPLKEHATGQAYCRWHQNGRDQCRYFGAWGSEAASLAYRRFQVEWAAGSAEGTRKPGQPWFVAEVGQRWLAHCERTYLKRGKITSEVHCCRRAWAVLGELYGDEPAEEFDARKLRAVRQAMVAEQGWARTTVNDQVSRIVRGFAWAATLAAGRTTAPERKPKQPVEARHIEVIFPHLHPSPKRRAVVEAMIRLQRLTGMRPGELCGLGPDDLDRRREPWRYEVAEFNKMLHRDVRRVVFIGPQGRAILTPFLVDAAPGLPIFRFPPWREGAGWSLVGVQRYRKLIRLACLAAGVPVWSPHRLRHTKATEVMDRCEDDAAAGLAIGDSAEVARQVYARAPGEAVAKWIAEETG